jgi:hypothetical protein
LRPGIHADVHALVEIIRPHPTLVVADRADRVVRRATYGGFLARAVASSP